MNHRDEFWKWLIFGFRRLTSMVEEHAESIAPSPEHLEMLRGFAARLLAVTSKFDAGESKRI